MSYTPDPGSLAAVVCAYLRDNPDVTELSIATMCRLWPGKAKTSNVNPCLATPLTHNLLTRARSTAGELVYRRGRCFDGPVKPVVQPPQPVITPPAPPPPALAELEAKRADLLAHIEQTRAERQEPEPSVTLVAPPAKQHPKGPPPGKAPNRLPPIDVSQLVLRTNVPLPSPAAAQKGRTRYDDAFDLLTVEGYSVAYPRAYMGSLQQAARTYGKRHKVHLLVRVDPVNLAQCAVWRVSALDAQKSAELAINNKLRSAA